MSLVHKPPTTPLRDHPGDNLDGLLRAFFQAELPNPWPPFRPALHLPERRPVWSRFQSALALAASIGILVIGLSLVAGKFEPVKQTVPPGDLPGALRDPIQKERIILEVPDDQEGPVAGKPGRASYRIEYYER
jgi:hypothetical protein